MADEIDPLEAFGGEDFDTGLSGEPKEEDSTSSSSMISEEELASAFGGDMESFFGGEESPPVVNDDIASAAFGDIIGTGAAAKSTDPNLEMVFEIPVKVAVELGDTTITIKELLGFGPGSVLELQRLAGEPANLVVNGVMVGRGDVVVVNENYGLRITELISSEERIKKLSQ
mgnify:CR=1 FL=1